MWFALALIGLAFGSVLPELGNGENFAKAPVPEVKTTYYCVGDVAICEPDSKAGGKRCEGTSMTIKLTGRDCPKATTDQTEIVNSAASGYGIAEGECQMSESEKREGTCLAKKSTLDKFITTMVNPNWNGRVNFMNCCVQMIVPLSTLKNARIKLDKGYGRKPTTTDSLQCENVLPSATEFKVDGKDNEECSKIKIDCRPLDDVGLPVCNFNDFGCAGSSGCLENDCYKAWGGATIYENKPGFGDECAACARFGQCTPLSSAATFFFGAIWLFGLLL